MQAPELTLAAAIRDADCAKVEARHKAIRNLAPALLVEIGKPGPLWKAAELHASGPQVVAALQVALAADDPPLRSMAAIGLGMIGEPSLLDRVADWIDLAGDDADASFQRECAVIALSFIGAAARESGEAEGLRSAVYRRLRSALRSERPDVRFQAAIAVAEVGGDEAEATLVRALQDEQHVDVRENIIDALSRFDKPQASTCDALVAIVDDAEEGPSSIGFAAAMVLAGAGRSEAGPRLVDALRIRHERDRALEALAVMGPRAPASAIDAVQSLARGFLTPGITRARAGYALARLSPEPPERNPGHALLRKLAWHPRAAVREAVADAEKNLRDLAER